MTKHEATVSSAASQIVMSAPPVRNVTMSGAVDATMATLAALASASR